MNKYSRQTDTLHSAQDPDCGTDASLEQQNYGLILLAASSSEVTAVKTPVDLIFVHGLGGHILRTWTHRNQNCWPRDSLQGELPDARVYSYGYPSKVFANKSVAGIREFAGHLLDDIRVQVKGSRPIIFVCHSLGGIVVKQAMILAHRNDNHKAVLSCTKGIIFMGTPHGGSQYADYGKVLADVANIASRISMTHRWTGGVRASLIEGLKAQNPELRAIGDDFVAIVQTYDLRVINFFETEAHPRMNKTVSP